MSEKLLRQLNQATSLNTDDALLININNGASADEDKYIELEDFATNFPTPNMSTVIRMTNILDNTTDEDSQVGLGTVPTGWTETGSASAEVVTATAASVSSSIDEILYKITSSVQYDSLYQEHAISSENQLTGSDELSLGVWVYPVSGDWDLQLYKDTSTLVDSDTATNGQWNFLKLEGKTGGSTNVRFYVRNMDSGGAGVCYIVYPMMNKGGRLMPYAPKPSTGGGGASGNPFRIIQAMPTGTLAATIDYRAGGSTPAEQVMVWDFDDSTIEYMDFKCRLEGYQGGGLTFTLPWSATSATSGDVLLQLGIRRIADDAEDIDASHTYVYNSVTDTAPSASGEVAYPKIAFTDGADMDSWADGEVAIVRVRRNAADGSDTMTGDAELWALVGKETTA